MINITLKDGTIMQVENGVTCLDVAKQISAGLARAALAAEVDGQTVDLKTPLEKDCTMSVLTFDDDMGKWTLRHTASHVLAQAVKHLYPDVKLAIGPAIDNGFYYDIDSEHNFTPEDLEKIEAEMIEDFRELIADLHPSGTSNLQPVLARAVDYLEENREIVRALVRGTGVEGFGRKMITVLEECHLEMRPFRSVEDAYAARFLATGIVGMMEKWITEPQPIPKNEIVELINRVLTGNLI